MALAATGSRAVASPTEPRSYAMCPPVHFAVSYRINPWMHPDRPVHPADAMAQWKALADVYRAEGHRVVVVEPAPDLPDMVFAANAGIVLDGRVLLSRFRHPQRRREEEAFRSAFAGLGLSEVVQASYVNEGQGDYLLADGVFLGASGFRTDALAHAEVRDFFGREVVGVELVDPRFYHLDTALTVLGAGLIAYWPGAFSPASQAVLRERYPDAVIATEDDASAFGLNAVSDGSNVVLARGTQALAPRLGERGLRVIEVDTTELQKAGGSVRCCTLELRT